MWIIKRSSQLFINYSVWTRVKGFLFVQMKSMGKRVFANSFEKLLETDSNLNGFISWGNKESSHMSVHVLKLYLAFSILFFVS